MAELIKIHRGQNLKVLWGTGAGKFLQGLRFVRAERTRYACLCNDVYAKAVTIGKREAGCDALRAIETRLAPLVTAVQRR